ncbi:TPA: pheA operon leader peptide PheL, partial [Klebsiella pneumoniae subsp. pneumoniae]|nr:pheA operon leader peptide PheL [Klebsiella pneumoniae subsp. pneumoniae]
MKLVPFFFAFFFTF